MHILYVYIHIYVFFFVSRYEFRRSLSVCRYWLIGWPLCSFGLFVTRDRSGEISLPRLGVRL